MAPRPPRKKIIEKNLKGERSVREPLEVVTEEEIGGRIRRTVGEGSESIFVIQSPERAPDPATIRGRLVKTVKGPGGRRLGAAALGGAAGVGTVLAIRELAFDGSPPGGGFSPPPGGTETPGGSGGTGQGEDTLDEGLDLGGLLSGLGVGFAVGTLAAAFEALGIKPKTATTLARIVVFALIALALVWVFRKLT